MLPNMFCRILTHYVLAVKNLNYTHITQMKADETSPSACIQCYRLVCCCGQDSVLGRDKDVGHFSCVQMHYKRPENSFEGLWDESRGCCYCRAGLTIYFLWPACPHTDYYGNPLHLWLKISFPCLEISAHQCLWNENEFICGLCFETRTLKADGHWICRDKASSFVYYCIA